LKCGYEVFAEEYFSESSYYSDGSLFLSQQCGEELVTITGMLEAVVLVSSMIARIKFLFLRAMVSCSGFPEGIVKSEREG
jgi:hypothetical protein